MAARYGSRIPYPIVLVDVELDAVYFIQHSISSSNLTQSWPLTPSVTSGAVLVRGLHLPITLGFFSPCECGPSKWSLKDCHGHNLQSKIFLGVPGLSIKYCSLCISATTICRD
ncbi:hypothetical protein BS17DRAFT_783235, partial [Gyrodon lividus]